MLTSLKARQTLLMRCTSKRSQRSKLQWLPTSPYVSKEVFSLVVFAALQNTFFTFAPLLEHAKIRLKHTSDHEQNDLSKKLTIQFEINIRDNLWNNHRDITVTLRFPQSGWHYIAINLNVILCLLASIKTSQLYYIYPVNTNPVSTFRWK